MEQLIWIVILFYSLNLWGRWDDDDFYVNAVNANASGIILLDATPKSHWRVSSPYSGNLASLFVYQITQHIKENSQEKVIPFLLIQETDWHTFDSHLMFIFENKKYLEEIFSCTNQNSVKIGTETVKIF